MCARARKRQKGRDKQTDGDREYVHNYARVNAHVNERERYIRDI